MYGFQNLILVFLLQYFFLQVCAKIRTMLKLFAWETESGYFYIKQ